MLSFAACSKMRCVKIVKDKTLRCSCKFATGSINDALYLSVDFFNDGLGGRCDCGG